jgi:ketose-bisphosphate aldolase
MSIVSFDDLMTNAEQGQYAVGYFESWNMESLQAVADAAEATRSPVILGFSGIYIDHPKRVVKEHISFYAALGIEVCRQISVPSCLIYNESPYISRVMEAIDLGFGLVMFANDTLNFDDQAEYIRQVVDKAHRLSAAVEGEIASPPGIDGELTSIPDDMHLTPPELARAFVERTGLDALAVNIGQAHLHGRSKIHLNFPRLIELKKAVTVPLVLHGASSISRADIEEAIRLGVRKINVGSVLKRTYFEAIHSACENVNQDYNPYDIIGSGLDSDVLIAGRMALQKTVEDLMRLFGSSGKA